MPDHIFGIPATKRKIFVSYHHGGDQPYYDTFSSIFCDTYDVIFDNSLERKVDSEDVDYVMRRIREDFITGSSCTIVLVGQDTSKRKYIDWEISTTLDKEHGLIGVALPTAPRTHDGKIIVPDRLHDNIASGYAVWANWGTLTAITLAKYIEEANNKSQTLADNSRNRKMRNS